MKKITVIVFIITLTYLNLYSQWTYQNVAGSNALNAVHFENTLTGWVAGDNTVVYKTTNGGVNWTQQITGMPAGQYNSLAFTSTTIGWAIGAYTSTGMAGYIYKTINGGANWTQQLNAVNHIFYSSFLLNDTAATCWVAGTYQGTSAAILRTTNGGTNWTTQLTGQYTPIKSIFFADAFTGWAAGNNTMLKTTNSGITWSPNTFAGNVQSLFFNDAFTGWAGLDNGNLLRTTNGGISWLTAYTTGISSSVSSISFPNSVTGYFTFSNVVFKTTNSGFMWTPFETQVPGVLKAISCPTVNNCFGAGTLGNIIKTNNGGGVFASNRITFRRNNLNKFITLNNVTYDTIAVNLARSTNAIITDINVSIDTVINTPDSTLTFILTHNFVNDTLIYRAGGAGSNFIGTNLNDSASVSILGGTPPFTGTYKPSRPLSQFNFASYNGLWILKINDSNSGKSDRTGVIKSWSITITYNVSIGVNNISEIIPSAYELKQNYPNPFNPATNIKFLVKETNLVTLKVYDMLGKEITTLVNENLNPGEYETKFDGSALTSGIYFYRLTSGDFTATKKLVLIK